MLGLPLAASAQRPAGFEATGKKVWDLSLWTGEGMGVAIGSSSGSVRIAMAGFSVSRVVRGAWTEGYGGRTLEYVFEAQPLFLVTSPQTVYGGGFSPVGLRWSFARRGQYRPYVEWNGGGVFTDNNVPPGRTASFNFTTSLGPGVMIHTHENQAISVAARFWHLSNAATGHTNPSFNTVQLVVGYHWLRSRLPLR